jgi:hypothetical protein
MSYNSLPDESILEITSLVCGIDIESFALVNKRTLNIAHGRLEEWRALKHHGKIMAARFPEHPYPFRTTPELLKILRPYLSNMDRPEIQKRYEEQEQGGGWCNAAPDLDYLHLKGDLHWLQPMDEKTVQENIWPNGKTVSKEELDVLIASADRVGVKFPDAFIKIMGSTELMQRLLLGGSYFLLGPSLVKCNSWDDKDSGGYVIRFFSDQQGCWTLSLYLAPGGRHCILYTPEDVHCFDCGDRGSYWRVRDGPFEGHPKYEPFEGIPRACNKLDVGFAHADFEEWLATNYFNGWCLETLFQGRELTEPLKEYVANLK